MGDPAIGTRSTVVIDYEASWGVDKGSPAGFQVGVVSCELTPEQELLDNDTIRGDFNANDPANGKKSAQGQMTIIPTVTQMPWFQKLLCGGNTTTGGADPYTHAAKLTSTMPLSAVVEVSYNINGTLRYTKANGCRINRVRIPMDPVGFMKLGLDFAASDMDANRTTVYSASPTSWITGTQFDNLMIAAADIKIGGSAVGYIGGGELTLDMALQTDDYRVGAGGARGSLLPGICRVGGNLNLCLDSTAVLTLLTNGAYSSIQATWTAAANRTFSILLPRLRFKKTGPTLKGPTAVMVSCEVKGSYDTTAGSSFTLTTVNDQAGTVYV